VGSRFGLNHGPAKFRSFATSSMRCQTFNVARDFASFGVRVTDKGAKGFIVYRRIGGEERPRRLWLGTYRPAPAGGRRGPLRERGEWRSCFAKAGGIERFQ
jgi:hypothetical protein